MDSFKIYEKAPTGQSLNIEKVLDMLVFNEQGLIPAIAQQHDSGEVLMMAWMNKTALLETLNTGRVCYWSRSRQQYWRKGESSGNEQHLISMRADCDGDALLLLVDQHGPACHTNRRNCFYIELTGDHANVLTEPVN